MGDIFRQLQLSNQKNMQDMQTNPKYALNCKMQNMYLHKIRSLVIKLLREIHCETCYIFITEYVTLVRNLSTLGKFIIFENNYIMAYIFCVLYATDWGLLVQARRRLVEIRNRIRREAPASYADTKRSRLFLAD